MNKKKEVNLGSIALHGKELFLIAGPCVIEDRGLMLETASELSAIASEKNIPLIFKSSYTKDNRSSLEYDHGPGIDVGLKILAEIKEQHNLPLLSDIHSADQAKKAAEVLDVIQIPAYLCMQSSLVKAAAETGAVINLKHAQFLAPQNMRYPVAKCEQSGNNRILLTERGVSFGYNDLVVDPRSFYELNLLGYPLVFDITHSIRKYGVPSSKASGGAKQYLPLLARVGAAAGINGVFIEVHPEPENAKCDAASQLPLSQLPDLLDMILEFHNLANKYK